MEHVTQVLRLRMIVNKKNVRGNTLELLKLVVNHNIQYLKGCKNRDCGCQNNCHNFLIVCLVMLELQQIVLRCKKLSFCYHRVDGCVLQHYDCGVSHRPDNAFAQRKQLIRDDGVE